MRATIDDGADLFTLVNTFVVAPDRQDAVVRSLRDFTERHARSMPGFVGASVHVSVDRRRVVNYVQWETEADFRAMMESAPAKAHLAEVGALAERVDPVACKVAFVVSRAHAPR